MPQEVFRQGNFTNGELDPKMVGRRELKAYFASLAGAANLLPTPQGPITRRPGLAMVGPIRNPLTPVIAPQDGVTAPNGGSVVNVLTGPPACSFTGSIAGTTLTVDAGSVVGAPIAIGMVITDTAGLIEGGTTITAGSGLSWTVSNSLTVTDEAMSGMAPGPVSTTALGTTVPYVFLEVDFGAPVEISCVDIINYAVIPAGGLGSGAADPTPPIIGGWNNNSQIEQEFSGLLEGL